MPHRSHLAIVVIDVPSHERDGAVAFWGGALGREMRQLPEPEFHGARLSPDLAVLVQGLDEGLPRVHLDIHTDDVAAEVARLAALGASVVEHHEEWTVMHDPSGLTFCVVAAPEGTLDAPDVTEWP